MKATELLKEDHGRILRALNVLEKMATRAEREKTLDPRAVEDIVAFLQVFADRHHQGKEEGILFPALLQDRTQKNYDNLCCLIFEHNQERYLVEGLGESIQTKNTREFVYCASRLIESLRSHIEKENLILFELADSVLSPIDDKRVAAEMQKFEQPGQRKVLADLLIKLDALESEYTGEKHVRTAVRS